MPQTALALDCAVPTAGQYVRGLVNAGTPHIVIRGRMELDPGQDRFAPLVDGARDLSLTGSVTGRLFTPDGYGATVELKAIERHFCHDPWCDGPPPSQVEPPEVFYVLRNSRRGLFFESGMCAFETFPASEDTEADLLACMVNSPDCPPPRY